MKWDDKTRSGLETALNESDVVGVRMSPSGDSVDVLLQVWSLPPVGPLDRDGRRVLRLTAASELCFVLRHDNFGADVVASPALPLDDLGAVEAFFEALTWSGSIYGWEFFDKPSLTEDWPDVPSLVVPIRTTPASHTFYWFNECGTGTGGEQVGYCIEGTVTFDDAKVFDAFGNEVPTETFISDGVRQWDALYADDMRMSVDAQRTAQTEAPKWRSWATGSESAMLPAGVPEGVRTIESPPSVFARGIKRLAEFFTFQEQPKE